MISKSVLFGLGLVITGSMFVASGAQIVQTVNISSQTLEINGLEGLGTFYYFQSHPDTPTGAILTGVTLQISVSEVLQNLVVKNTASQSQSFRYRTYTNLTADGTAPADDLAQFLTVWFFASGSDGRHIDLYDTGTLSYAAGQERTFANPPVNASLNSGPVTSADYTAYDTTGDFSFGFSTETSQTFSGGGGNASATQSTTGSGTIQVIYNYDLPEVPPSEVPEPGTYAMLGSGLVLLGAYRRRR